MAKTVIDNLYEEYETNYDLITMDSDDEEEVILPKKKQNVVSVEGNNKNNISSKNIENALNFI